MSATSPPERGSCRGKRGSSSNRSLVSRAALAGPAGAFGCLQQQAVGQLTPELRQRHVGRLVQNRGRTVIVGRQVHGRGVVLARFGQEATGERQVSQCARQTESRIGLV